MIKHKNYSQIKTGGLWKKNFLKKTIIPNP